MDEVEKTKNKMLKLLRAIRSLDDIKEHKDELLSVIQESSGNALQSFRDLIETAGSMSPEEIEKELARFQDERLLLGEEILQEFDRIDQLPGAMMYIESFMVEMEERNSSYRQEFLGLLPGFIKILEKDMEGGMTPGLRSMINNMMAESEPGTAVKPGPAKQDRVKIADLEIFYNIGSVDDLKKEKDKLIDTLEGLIKNNLEELRSISEAGMPPADARERADKVMNRMDSYENEMEIEFNRLTKLPGAAAEIKSFHEEIRTRFGPNVIEIEKLFEELRR